VVTIDLLEILTSKTLVGELFAQRPIRIMVTAIQDGQVKLGLSADLHLLIRQLLPALLYLPHPCGSPA